jgi:hypothetical protein
MGQVSHPHNLQQVPHQGAVHNQFHHNQLKVQSRCGQINQISRLQVAFTTLKLPKTGPPKAPKTTVNPMGSKLNQKR